MDTKLKELNNDSSKCSENVETDRRAFIKKLAYSAPKLVVLGYLSKNTQVHADGTGGPDGPPTGWNPWS